MTADKGWIIVLLILKMITGPGFSKWITILHESKNWNLKKGDNYFKFQLQRMHFDF